ncbi:MAG: cadmium-translocating P-type ATPase [Desulfurococcales archaeon]|nr:cadmium-translocating P-type ATPase [Desulfurococcales archaeon]
MTLRITRESMDKAREQYRLVGVHCVSCKRVIETELSRIPGVERAEVDPNTGTLTLALAGGVDRREIVEAVRRVGYDIVLERLVLRVEGLKEGMGKPLEEKLKRIPGVVDARVYEAGRIVRVEFDPLAASSDDIVGGLAAMGLKAEPLESESKRDYTRHALAAVAISTLVYAAGLLTGSTPLAAVAGLVAYLVSFYGFVIPALKAALHGYLIMDTLLALGTTVALAISVYGLFTGGPLYFDAIVFITLFVLAGRYVEERLRSRAERILAASKEILPEKARVERRGTLVEISESEVKPGETVVVRTGERIPVDGRIHSGTGEVDESPVTGESEPRHVATGDLVLAGSTLVRGWLKVTALRTGRYRLVARALEAAREAGLYKPRLQEIADRVVSVFVPVVLAVAAATVAGHIVLGSTITTALLAAATVLVVACPCALGIAIPTGVAASVARAYRMGLILKRPDVLEQLARVGIVAFDKTGTLTKGKPVVVDAKPVEGPLEESLRLAAALESGSNHPLARAIVDYYNTTYGGDPPRPESLDEVPGLGLVGVVDGLNVAVGGARLLEELGLEEPRVGVEGYTRVYVVVDNVVRAVIGLEDEVREDAARLVKTLHGMGVKTCILSGDAQPAVERVAERLGIPGDCALGRLDPLGKAERISRLRREAPVAYVGDGVNDGPALAEADVGIAVNEALDVARQAGDIVLARNNMELVVYAIELARRAARTIRFNLFWAFAYNTVLIPVAAGVLSPLGVTIGPEVAALVMSLSSITVTSNSARILYWRPRRAMV